MNLNCPLPQTDFDVITIAHGGGGMLMQQLLDTGVFAVLANPILDQRHDGALLNTSGRIAFSTDSYIVSPIFFPGGNIGELAVNGTVNDLAMCGAIPQYLSLSFIIEEGFLVTEFQTILNSIKKACIDAKVQIVTGDTKVVEKGKGDKIFINTSGIGEVHPQASISLKNIQLGDQIIVSNSIASHGMAIMSVRKGLEFESNILSDTCALDTVIRQIIDRFGNKIHFLRDPTRGGVASVLNEIATDANVGITIQQNKIPVEQQVSAACEILGLDPLYVANEGVFIAIVANEIAEDLISMLHQCPRTSQASLIGEVTDSHLGKVILNSIIGGKRIINRLTGEQLPRIC